MGKGKNRLSARLLAALLSAAMVFGSLPFSSVPAYAASSGHPDAVTITVTDNDGMALSGAAVTYHIYSVSGGAECAAATAYTDEYGCVEVLPGEDFVEGDLTLSASASKDGYVYADGSGAISNAVIASGTQDFTVRLRSTTITGITVDVTSVTYNGKDHPAVTVHGTEDGDIITYRLNDGEPQTDKPLIREPGTYKITVRIQRDGYTDYEESFSAEILKAVIEESDLKVTPYAGDYDGEEHRAIKIEGLLGTDTVTYSVNGGETTDEAPVIKNVGVYCICVHIERYGYEDFDRCYEAEIVAIPIDGLSTEPYKGVYDGKPHYAVEVTGTEAGDVIEYKLGDGEWTEENPQIKNAGSYEVWARVSRDNYETTELDPVTASIERADTTLSFNSFTDSEKTEVLSGPVPYSQTYDFSVTTNADADGGSIFYSVELSEEGIAEIDENTGKLRVYYPGTITVTAAFPGNENYNEAKIQYTLSVKGTVKENGDYIAFAQDNVDYVIGAYGGVASAAQVEMKDGKITGSITYSIPDAAGAAGLAIDDPSSGQVKVTDYNALTGAIRNSGGTFSFAVTAKKEATELYGEDEASYVLNITFAETPETPYTLDKAEGNDNWYTSAVTVTPNDGYNISKEVDPQTFEESVSFSDQGTHTRYVYLQNNEKGVHCGEITDRVEVNIKIDTEKPENMKITYSTDTLIDEIISAITFGFYKPSVTVTIEAYDATSGLDHLDWTYEREAGASEANLENASGELPFDEDGIATLTLTADEARQYRGSLSFTATDKAGNVSDEYKDDGHVIVIDTIAPDCSISYGDPKETVDTGDKIQRYFDGDVTLTITVTENNFYEEDFHLSISRDGADATLVAPEWTTGGADNIFIGTYTLSGDGDYVVYADYADRSGNEGQLGDDTDNPVTTEYASDIITIDTVSPQVTISYEQDSQATTFAVVEHNFRPEDIKVSSYTAKDINGNPVFADGLEEELRNAAWTKNGDIYTYVKSDYADGIYQVELEYMDPAKHSCTESGSFTIDHSDPSDPEITYSESIKDTVLSALTLGFYNPSVTVTFTSYDNFSGVEYFTWSYTRQDGASSANVASYAETRLEAVPDSGDKSKFTATISLPRNDADQIRGTVSASATDACGNTGNKVTDSGHVLVVDTISPTMAVEYSEESNRVGSVLYYGSDKDGQATITLHVTEANFFAEDVTIKVSKEDGITTQVTPTWTDAASDGHAASFTISGDGRYSVSVEYTDRSNNSMEEYTSDTIIIDTVKPAIDVAYQNSRIVNTLAKDGHQRDYFDSVQTAVVTVTEANFSEENVQLSILAEDVAGAERSAESLVTKSAWTTDGDVHRMTITYAGDANYTFDVECTDLARNKAADYSPDYFTVDTVAPAVTGVTYSTSVLETILSGITFGFYQAKMTVTVTATDDTSGIHRFGYSCLSAAGVSSVNTQILNQAIEEAAISYSDGGRAAAVSFEIPGGGGQFNGTVSFDVSDRSGNQTEQAETKRIVVDSISPTATVTYNSPVNTVGGTSYYDGSINGTITINEANFYPDDTVTTVSADGGAAQTLPVTWPDSGTDIHTGTFALTGDGDYIVAVSYRDKSGNAMADYTSGLMTIDTEIEEPDFTINGIPQSGDNGGAYKGEAEVAFHFEDRNYASSEITLTRARFDKTEDVTDEFIKVSLDDTGGSGSFGIPELAENDGIYLLTVTMTDKAGHSAESHVRFVVNRFGSVYVYSDYLCSLIRDGGQYVKLNGDAAITEDLLITEYNADEIIEGSLNILITRDGEPLDADYTTAPADAGGWHEYAYAISRGNFLEDGVYKITLSSKDATGNTSSSVPENSMDEDGNPILDTMTFTVDTTAPEIRNITNLEKAIADRDAIEGGKLNVTYTLFDIGGLAKAEIYLNGEIIDTVESFDGSSYSGAFDIPESTDVQTVRLVVADLAGNITDTASGGFDPGELYEFHDRVTVSADFFVRWYRNTPLFWGTVGGAAVVLAAAILLILLLVKRRKKDAENA